ncbi:MAG: hypothetical protein QXK12_04810 [Candidatus Nezhaarchaeales archaeon]
MDPLLQKYVKDINEVCGNVKEYVVTLKYDKRDEALQRLMGKSELISTPSRLLVKARYKGKEMSIVPGGRIVFRNVHDVNELKNVLMELLGSP